MKEGCYNMDRTSTGFIEKALEYLYQVTDQYGVIPVGTIMKIEQVIGELEYLIKE
jgi:hypothetical protein